MRSTIAVSCLLATFSTSIAFAEPRERLTDGRRLHVHPVGRDDGKCTKRRPCKTIQRAVERVCHELDLAGHQARILLARGRYVGGVGLCSYVGGGRHGQATAIVMGNPKDRSAVVLHAPDGDAIVSIGIPTVWTFANMRIEAPRGASAKADLAGVIALDGVELGDAAVHAKAMHGGKVEFVNRDYYVPGSAAAHWSAEVLSEVMVQPQIKVHLIDEPRFGVFAQASHGSHIYAPGVEFKGKAKGRRYSISQYSTIEIGRDLSELPGDE